VFSNADPEIVLEIKLPDLSVFRCRENTMWSIYVPEEAVEARYLKKKQVLRREELEEQGVGNFCLRAVTSLAKSCGKKWGLWLQITLLIYHIPADRMPNVGPAVDDPAWPGIKLTEGQLALLPTAGPKSKMWGGKDWGAPIVPVLAPGTPMEAAPGPPDQEQLLEACRTLLNRGCLAEAVLHIESMEKRWQAIQEKGGPPKRRPAEKTWPEKEKQGEKPSKGRRNMFTRVLAQFN